MKSPRILKILLWLRKRLDYWKLERPAWRVLRRVGGRAAVAAMRDAFAKAEQYHPLDDWSLSYHSMLVIAALIIREDIKHVVEFGAGYSTIALVEFCRQTTSSLRWDSFEHQEDFAKRIREHLPLDERYHLHTPPLVQVSDQNFMDLFSIADPVGYFLSVMARVSDEKLLDTRLRNCFYGFDFRYFLGHEFDLVVIDGPSGNGRSLAFPLLRNVLRLPTWLLLDDFAHYPYVQDLARVFAYEYTVPHCQDPNQAMDACETACTRLGVLPYEHNCPPLKKA